MKRGFILLIVFTFLLVPTILACPEINLAKDSYLQGETFQAEITGYFAKSLSYKNFVFYNQDLNKYFYSSFEVVKITNNKYFVYSDLPSTPGNYIFEAKDIYCISNGKSYLSKNTRGFLSEKPLSDLYKTLESKLNFNSFNGEETALSVLAFENDQEQKINAIINLDKFKKDECYKKYKESSKCDLKSTAISLFSLSKINQTTNSSYNWLLSRFNSKDLGGYQIKINSNHYKNQECILKIGNQESETLIVSPNENLFSLSFSNETNESEILLAVDCDFPFKTSVSLISVYNGISQESNFYKNQEFSFTFNNKKCFSKSKEEQCSSELTAFSLLALNSAPYDLSQIISKSKNWFKGNIKTNLEKAIFLIVYSDENTKYELLELQVSGKYWTKDQFSFNPDIKTTILSTYALSTQGIETLSKSWLQDQSYDNFLDVAYATSFVFDYSEVEPVLAVDPAIIRSPVNTINRVILRNRGIKSIDAVLSSSSIEEINKNIAPNQYSNVYLYFPLIYTETGIILDTLNVLYSSSEDSSKSYEVPLVILTPIKEISQEEPEQPPVEIINETQAEDPITNQTDQEIVINETVINNQTIYDILTANLEFREENLKDVKKVLQEILEEQTTYILYLHNPSESLINKIRITIGGTLYDIFVKVDPSDPIEVIDINETKEIKLTLNPKEFPANYNGFIKAEGKTDSGKEVSTILTVLIDVPAKEEESKPIIKKTSTEENKRICLHEEGGIPCGGDEICNTDVLGVTQKQIGNVICCVDDARGTKAKCVKPKEKPKWWIIILLIAIIFVIIGFIFFRSKKKQKKDMKSVVDKIEEKYNKRYPVDNVTRRRPR